MSKSTFVQHLKFSIGFCILYGCHTDNGGILVLLKKAVGIRCLLRRHDSLGESFTLCRVIYKIRSPLPPFENPLKWLGSAKWVTTTKHPSRASGWQPIKPFKPPQPFKPIKHLNTLREPPQVTSLNLVGDTEYKFITPSKSVCLQKNFNLNCLI